MKNICLYFEVDRPLRLKRYRFFNMGKDHEYLDEFANRSVMEEAAARCYLPMNALLLELIERYEGAFKVSFSLTGLVVEQFKRYAPQVLEGFKALAKTGCVEFVTETYSHSLSSLESEVAFREEVARNRDMLHREFGCESRAFANTELIYSDLIGETVADMGFDVMLTEGAKHVLGWKSPDFVYTNALNPRLKLLLRNASLTEDIALRFGDRSWSEWPLSVEKYATWLLNQDVQGEIANLFFRYETFGYYQPAETGIFDFMRYMPEYMLETGYFAFRTPSELAEMCHPVGVLSVPDAISWRDEEKDVTGWLGNELQTEALSKLYGQRNTVRKQENAALKRVWDFMQSADHFYYMNTKWFSSGGPRKDAEDPYDSPYDAFINYMNVLSDFILQLREQEEREEAEKRKKEAASGCIEATAAEETPAGTPDKAKPKESRGAEAV